MTTFATKSSFESFPLIITNDNNKSSEANDWSDQELDDLFQSPIDQVLDSMRYRSANQVSRTHCLRSIIYFSVICFLFGASFAFIFITSFRLNGLNEISSQFSSLNSVNQNNRKQLKPLSPYFDNKIRDKLLQQISTKRIALNLK